MAAKTLRISLVITIFFLITVLEIHAQSVTVSALLRPRFELQYGYKSPPDSLSDPQLLFSQRTRLNVAYNSDRFSAYVSIQDARVWGDQVQSSDVASMGLHEGWAQYNFSNKVALKIGRQEFVYDN